MAVSCAKENVAQDIETKNEDFVTTRTEGDCECEMRIDAVTGMDLTPPDDTWYVKDVDTSAPGFGPQIFSGQSNTSSASEWKPLPTASGTGGGRTIQLVYDFGPDVSAPVPPPPGFTVSVTIRCNRGSRSVSNVSHTFVWSAADRFFAVGENDPNLPVVTYFAEFDISSGCDDEEPVDHHPCPGGVFPC